MEDYQDIDWTTTHQILAKRTSHSGHHFLPHQLIAEYYPEKVPTVATILVAHAVPEFVLEPSLQEREEGDGSIEWAAEHSDELYAEYPNRWILVNKSCVLGSSSHPQELFQLARAHGIKEPFITLTTPPESPGTAVYSGQVV